MTVHRGPGSAPSVRRPLSVTEQRQRQLRILDAISRHCEDRGLRYYLCAGTLLGAVRHGGYIPWDDDIDLMLPRPDWERLCATFADTGNELALSLLSVPTSRSYALPFAKVCDDRTVLDVESDVIRDIGVYVDVFPLDGWASGRLRRRLQNGAINALTILIRIKHMQRRRRRDLRRAVLAVTKALTSPISARAVARALTWVATRCAFDTSLDAGIVVWGYHEVVPRHCYGLASAVTFEGRELPGPQDTDTVLRTIYGDYLTPPPAAQQISRHRFTAYALEPPGAQGQPSTDSAS